MDQQTIFTQIKLDLEKKGYDVYDGDLPPESTPYPFIYLGEAQQVDAIAKGRLISGDIYQTIHVWHNNPRKRGTLSRIIEEVKDTCCRVAGANGAGIRSINSRILPDNTTQVPLVHGVIEADFI